MHWFDGHLDLAYIAQHGRDLAQSPDQCGGTLQPASVTFPSLRAANVTAAVSTLFVRKQTDTARGPYCFTTPDEAHAAALLQIDMHRRWADAGLIRLAHIPPDANTGPIPQSTNSTPLSVTLAIEGAASIRTPEDLHAFHAAGVRIVSLAWAEGTTWSGGDQSGEDITPQGLTLIPHLDQLHIIHDVSHLSDRAFWTLLDQTNGKIIASHSNCRALLPDAKFPERHLSDAQIKALAARGRGVGGINNNGGIIGINLFARFLIPAADLKTRRATIADVIRHLQHIEQLTGSRDCLALGSDMDSGFGRDLLPEDLDGPEHLSRLAEALANAGWSDQEIQTFAHTTWQNLF